MTDGEWRVEWDEDGLVVRRDERRVRFAVSAEVPSDPKRFSSACLVHYPRALRWESHDEAVSAEDARAIVEAIDDALRGRNIQVEYELR